MFHREIECGQLIEFAERDPVQRAYSVRPLFGATLSVDGKNFTKRRTPEGDNDSIRSRDDARCGIGRVRRIPRPLRTFTGGMAARVAVPRRCHRRSSCHAVTSSHRHLGQPFTTHGDWERCLLNYADGTVPPRVWNSDWLKVGDTPLIPLIRSADVNVTTTYLNQSSTD